MEIIGLDRAYFGGLSKKDLGILERIYDEEINKTRSMSLEVMSLNLGSHKHPDEYEEAVSPKSKGSSSLSGGSTAIHLNVFKRNGDIFGSSPNMMSKSKKEK